MNMEVFESLRYDNKGLIPAIIQDWKTGEVLMVGYMNKESIRRTLATGRTHFWSRSRGEYWLKGETSGHFQYVKGVMVDCDSDALLVKVEQVGNACHTGNRSCFFTPLVEPDIPEPETETSAILDEVFDVIKKRKTNPSTRSYTSRLMMEGKDRILKKIGEEASEVIIASKNDRENEIVYEVADMWFHSLLVLGYHGIEPAKVYEELRRRRK